MKKGQKVKVINVPWVYENIYSIGDIIEYRGKDTNGHAMFSCLKSKLSWPLSEYNVKPIECKTLSEQ